MFIAPFFKHYDDQEFQRFFFCLRHIIDLYERYSSLGRYNQLQTPTTPVDTLGKLCATEGSLLDNGTLYRTVAGALQYLTQANIMYVVQHVCLFMHAHRESHFAFTKQILRYLGGTFDYK